MDLPDLATCSYTGYTRNMGYPVRISRSAPRWARLPSERFGTFTRWPAVPELAPARSYMDAPDEEFLARYREQLTASRTAITTALTGLAENAGGQQLVLLCFEKRLPNEYTCHRTMFAHWWTEITGRVVPELGGGR